MIYVNGGSLRLEEALAKWSEHNEQVRAHETKAREHRRAADECEKLARKIGELRSAYAKALAQHLGAESAFTKAHEEAAQAVAVDVRTDPPREQ